MFQIKAGNTLPTMNYDLSIAENFPVIDRSYKVDSSVAGRQYRSHMPINANINNGAIEENYCEFVINSNEQEFFDTSSLALEMKIKIVNENGEDVDNTSNFTLVDAFPLMLLKRCSVSLNAVAIENHSNFGLLNTIDSYLNMDKNLIPTLGKNMLFKNIDLKIHDKFTEGDFTNIIKDEGGIIQKSKRTMHFMVPLKLDISSLNFFLLNGVTLGIRFDLASPSILINSLDKKNYSYRMLSCKIWMQRILPNPDALISLNKNMIRYTSNIEYIYERPIVKQYVYPKGHNMISMDDIFNGVIPHKVIVFAIRQKALNGSYEYNSTHLNHCNISSIDLDINGNSVSALKGSFLDEIARIFHHTLINLKNNSNLLSHQSFGDGRMICMWNLQTSLCDDVLNVEKGGNLKINLQSTKPMDDNFVIFVIGITTGIFTVDSMRRVKTSFVL